MKLLVELRHVYGTKKYYPACIRSKNVAKLMRQLTFSKENVILLREIGFEVINVVPKDD